MAWLKHAVPHVLRGALVGLAVVLTSFFGGLEGIERWGLNTLFQLRGPQPPQSPIVIVSIDEDSFDELNLAWPFPRALHAQLLDIVSQSHPAAIGLDIVFAEPSARGPEDDGALARAIGRAGNVILAAAMTVVQEASYIKEDLNPPIKILRERAAGYGPVNFVIDDDAFVRSARLSRRYQETELHGFDLAIYRAAAKAGIEGTPYDGTDVLINYRGGAKTFLTVPYYRVLNGEVPPDTFAGQIVLVGATSPVLHDVFPAPFEPQGNMPGVEIHANVLETLFQGIPIRHSPWAVTVVLILMGSMAVVAVTNRLRPFLALGAVAAVGLAYTGLCLALFTWGRLWMDVITVPVALAFGYGATVLENFVREQREKRRLARFFSPKVLEEIIRHRSDQTLGTMRKRVTVLFSDIRGFTTLSEKLQPEQVVEILKEYLTELTEIVFRHGGTVDKYVGDCIMALYNVPFDQPEHAAEAVRTALDFQKTTHELSARWKAKLGIEIKNGVGINTGEAVVGTMGSQQRLEYTAIGDTVNLAARLESITKDFRSPVIVSESTYQDIRTHFRTRYLGEVTVKGKEIPVKIYAVVETADENARKETRVLVEAMVAVSDGAVTVVAPLSDLGHGGVAVHNLQRAFEIGQILQLRLELPNAKPIEVDGKVTWTAEEKAGFVFLDLTPERLAVINQFIGQQPSSARAGKD
jgi:adenylate cyclase